MIRILADLHIHTALSPCAEREMTPPAIVREALRKGLEMIAVCDHNSAGNVAAVHAAAEAVSGAGDLGARLAVVAGMEITTSEEVHVLGFFPDASAAARAAEEVRSGLPLWKALTSFGPRDAMRRPEQELMDAEGRVTGIEERMLGAASRFTLSQTVDLIRANGGLAVAAHVDRRAFSVIGQLGFLPPDARFDALEISAAGVARGRAAEFAKSGLTLLSGSDSHFLEDIGSSMTALELEEPCFEEMQRAFYGVGGRGCGIA
jgi:PHP family Zn ribbon phosphoesterase